MKLFYLATLSLFLIVGFSGFSFAQGNIDNGISEFKKGNFKQTVKILKEVKYSDKDSYLGYHYLGLAYVKLEKFGKAEAAFRKSIYVNDKFHLSKIGLAFSLMRKGENQEPLGIASLLVSEFPNDFEVRYIIALTNFRLGNYVKSLESSAKLIEMNPDFLDAYWIKYSALISVSPEILKEQISKYGTAKQALVKFISKLSKLENIGRWEKSRKALEFFARHYQEKSYNNKDVSDIVIYKRPIAGYTDKARNAGISGKIRALVMFQKDGTIGDVLIIEGLGFGLDRNVIKVAKKIKFKPAEKDGRPITVVKIVQYRFTIY